MLGLGGPCQAAVAGVDEGLEAGHVFGAVVHGAQVHAEAHAGVACDVSALGRRMGPVQGLLRQVGASCKAP